MKSRFYDPVIGRFLQPDTIVPEPANPQSLNRYSYVYNNPLRYSDPYGYCPVNLGPFNGGCHAVEDFFTGTVPSAGGDALAWSWTQGSSAFQQAWGQTQAAAMWSMGTMAAGAGAVADAAAVAAPAVGDYLADKGQDAANIGARWAIVTAVTGSPVAYPLFYPQDLFAFGISLGSAGDRRAGSFGFAMYQNCRGLCEFGPKVPWTPGYLAFASQPIPQRDFEDTFDHENQHGVQSILTGPAYGPVNIGINATCGFSDPCMHTRNPFEVDAIRAVTEGLHFPGFLLP